MCGNLEPVCVNCEHDYHEADGCKAEPCRTCLNGWKGENYTESHFEPKEVHKKGMEKQDIEILKTLMNKAKERELGVSSIIYYYALKHAIEELETARKEIKERNGDEHY